MPSLIDVFGAGGFDAGSVEPAADFSVLPPFNYAMKIQSCEVKKTKNGNGHFVAIEMEIMDGPEAGRRVRDNINIENPSEQCQKIGRASFSALCRAFDMVNCADPSVFIGQYVVAHVKVKINKDTKEKENQVRTYSPAKEYVPAAAGAPQASVAPAPTPVQPVTPPVQPAIPMHPVSLATATVLPVASPAVTPAPLPIAVPIVPVAPGAVPGTLGVPMSTTALPVISPPPAETPGLGAPAPTVTAAPVVVPAPNGATPWSR